MELSHIKMGPFSLYTIETGQFRLDGGAMFGVVPKVLWSRYIKADGKNRIPMAMRCLLIKSENTGKVYLVDNGIGSKFDKKYRTIYQIDERHSNLHDSLSYHGFKPEDVTDIIFTHLHFDHCGGTTYYDQEGKLAHTFANARYLVTHSHWETANNPNERETASFFEENIGPIRESGRLVLVSNDYTFEEGLTALTVNGHTLGQQLPMIKASGQTLVFSADLFPTATHVPLPWIMGYDMRPINTLEEKKRILNSAIAEDWYFFMEHDIENEVIHIDHQKNKFSAQAGLTLSDIAKTF